jgi:hypothetical protein
LTIEPSLVTVRGAVAFLEYAARVLSSPISAFLPLSSAAWRLAHGLTLHSPSLVSPARWSLATSREQCCPSPPEQTRATPGGQSLSLQAALALMARSAFVLGRTPDATTAAAAREAMSMAPPRLERVTGMGSSRSTLIQVRPLAG